MKEYIKIIKVQAKLFEKGDQDGYIKRYYDDEDIHEDGSISTSAFSGEHCIKVPYINDGNVKDLSSGFGREYLVINAKGERSLVDKDVFEKEYDVS